ncbi:DUF6182 family protein, partial [Streptomyces sp. SID14478]|uniref:DUF6182 family protein n=1 Tax=Streptomyces sp. SID14478 TaxID=2706073 RepID=UPI001EF1E949
PGRPRSSGRHRSRELYVATAGCTVADALVHVNHVLVEAVLDGLVTPGDLLTVRQVPSLTGTFDALDRVRAVADPHGPGRLRAVAGLGPAADRDRTPAT